MQDFNQTWTDDALYTKYGLDEAEIDLIETIIKPIEDAMRFFPSRVAVNPRVCILDHTSNIEDF